MYRIIIFSVLIIFTTRAVVAAEYEADTRTFAASSVQDAGVLEATLYTINETVTVEGYMNHYKVDSEFGQFNAVGNLGLKTLLREIDAIAELKQRSATDAGSDAVVGVITDTGESLAAVATNPVGTVKGLSSGASRFFKRTVRKTKDLSDKASEALADDESKDSDADDSTDEGGDDIDVQETSKKLAESYLGVGKAHRALARELKVDPYSQNEVLQAELNRVAKISGSTRKVTKILIPIPTFLNTAKSVSNMVWNLSPLDLLIQNEETLESMGFKNKQIKAFFENKFYSPTQRTILVSSLKLLDKVVGRELILQIANAAESRFEGEFIVRSALYAQLYHENIAPLANILRIPDGMLPVLIAESGEALVFAPLDYLLWTEEAAGAVKRLNALLKQQGITGDSHLWIEGQVSELAESSLQALNWGVSENGFQKLQEKIKAQESSQ